MEKKNIVLSKNVTPTTKRIGIICLSVLATTALIIAAFGEIDFNDALLVVVPVMTSISAWVDGGK